MIRISHKRVNCIGCAACVEIAPNYWEMGGDGLASLNKISHRHHTLEFATASDDDEILLLQCVEDCPVKIINII